MKTKVSKHTMLMRVFFLAITCLLIFPGISAAAVAEEPDQVVIEAPDVQSSVESYLEAVAINGQTISPTAYPEADLGDVITFRVRVQNTYPGTLRLLQCGVGWGEGLVYQGNLVDNHVKCRYDDQARKIFADIETIPGDPDDSVIVAERLPASSCWYTFDLKTVSCDNLTVHVYTDELYSCEAEKVYYAAAKITTPEIRYSVAISPRKIITGETQPVTISITNVGDGRASSFVMETNLEKFFVTISKMSPSFVYDAEAGAFMTGEAIDPGQSITLDFDLDTNRREADLLPEEMILFRPVYADNCGLRLQAPETLVMLRPAGERPKEAIRGADLGVEISARLPEVVKECDVHEAVVTITKTSRVSVYDLEVVLDTGSYAYLGGLVTTGFDGRKPLVHTSRPGVVFFSFDNDPDRAEPLTKGGSLRFNVRKKCLVPAGMNVSARFVDWLSATSAAGQTPAGQALPARKREVSAYAGPILTQSPDLELRVTPECCRLEQGQPMPWNIYVTNCGNAPAFDVTIEDILPDNLVFQKVEDEAKDAPRMKKNAPAFGETTLQWKLGEVAPSRTRKVTVVALPRTDKAASEVLVNTTNTTRVFSGCEGDACLDKNKTAPCFILPDGCISDVYEKPEKIHGFLSLAQIYKSNLYDAYENPKSAWGTYITPGVWLALPASHERLVEIATTSATPGGLAVSPFFPKNDRRYQAYMLYSPQWEFYHNESDLNMLTHRLDGYIHFNSRNRFTLQLIDQYKRAHDSVSSRANTIEDKYRTNLFSAVSTIGLTEKFELRLDYSNFWVDYDGSENKRNNRVDNSCALYGYFHLTEKTWLFAEYEYTGLDYKRNYLDADENRYFAGLRWEVTDKTSGQIKGGYGKRTYDADGLSDVGTWMAEVIVDYDVTEKTRIVANAYRRYEESMGEGLHWDNDALFGNVSTNMLTHMVGLSVAYDVTSKLHLNLHATLFYDEYAYEYDDVLWEDKKRRDREYAISPAIKFDFLKWLTFDLAYTYTHLDSNYAEAEHTDHTAFLRGTIYR